MALNRELLDAIVREVPAKFDELFRRLAFPDEIWGACTTYARILAEVLGEFKVKAEVRPVYIETANPVGIEYLAGKISEAEAIGLGGKIQVWGDIKFGQPHQHAVCYIPGWDVIVDLAMTPRLSKRVPCHPYWAEDRKFPWWLVKFDFRTYRLEYRVYETQPETVKKAEEFVRDLVRRYLR